MGGATVTGSVAVDVALGLVFTYLVFSTVCSGVNEALSRFMNRRGRELFDTINGLLGEVATQQQFWNHPLIKGLLQSRNLEATNEKFMGNALDTKAKDGVRTSSTKTSHRRTSRHRHSPRSCSTSPAPSQPHRPRRSRRSPQPHRPHQPRHPPPSTQPHRPRHPPRSTPPHRAAPARCRRRHPDHPVGAAQPDLIRIPAVEAIVKTVDPTRVQAEIENWFNDAMDRLSGYYKRWTKRVLLVLSVIVVVAFNVNTIQLAQSLWREPAVRAGVVQAAQNPTNPASSTASSQAINQAINLPIGWSSSTWHVDDGQWLWTIVGWLLSIGAISLGAPFWFGLLGKFSSLRSTGPPPTT